MLSFEHDPSQFLLAWKTKHDLASSLAYTKKRSKKLYMHLLGGDDDESLFLCLSLNMRRNGIAEEE